MLIIGFDRASLQEALADALTELGTIKMTTVARVEGTVTVNGVDVPVSGWDKVKIVNPGKKPDKK